MKQFERLGIIAPILNVIKEEKFDKPSEIQRRSIPLIVKGKDIIGGSETGSGKTLAFGAGIIQNSQKSGVIQSLVLTPTRELAEQITKELKKFSKYKPLSIVKVYGGVSINPQIHNLQKADVVVGTPGRILDHLGRGTIDLSFVKILVLDEADRMLDMGFIDDVRKITTQCPKQRQTLLFSATIAPELTDLSKNYMNKPIKVSAGSYVDPKKLKQIYYDVKSNMKFSLLVHLLKHDRSHLVMVFCESRANTQSVTNNLKDNGLKAQAIHGGLSQDKRQRALDMFHDKKLHILVCTDVAARGLDIKGVSHVYNYDIPKDSKQYIHRIGRTARAGKNGKAVNLLSERDHDNFQRVLSDFSVDIKKEEMPQVQKVAFKTPRRESRGFGGGRRSFGPRGSPMRSPMRSPRRSFGPRGHSDRRASSHRRGFSRPRGSSSRSSGRRDSSPRRRFGGRRNQ
jgi:ATP-dependent RNA helicase DeaD